MKKALFILMTMFYSVPTQTTHARTVGIIAATSTYGAFTIYGLAVSALLSISDSEKNDNFAKGYEVLDEKAYDKKMKLSKNKNHLRYKDYVQYQTTLQKDLNRYGKYTTKLPFGPIIAAPSIVMLKAKSKINYLKLSLYSKLDN
ncbi:MAG: hypothetical protein NTU89_04285 [Candidatus Dependentiae bacterium]|nr:hypothetical protein [Candidatus Dependentiae bacterium]